MLKCPECDGPIDVDEEELDEGDSLSCDECGADLQVIGVDPVGSNRWTSSTKKKRMTTSSTTKKNPKKTTTGSSRRLLVCGAKGRVFEILDGAR